MNIEEIDSGKDDNLQELCDLISTREDFSEYPLESESVGASSEVHMDEHLLKKPKKELTTRAIAVGLLIGMFLCCSNMYFGLQTGWVTMGSLQSALIGFGFFKAFDSRFPGFTIQENVVLQTTAVAVSTAPLSFGFVGVLPALDILSPNEVNSTVTQSRETPRNALYDTTHNVLSLAWWCFGLAFFGVFFAVPLRKQVILKEKLKFPSGRKTFPPQNKSVENRSMSVTKFNSDFQNRFCLERIIFVCSHLFSTQF